MSELKERIDKSYEVYHRPPHQFDNMVHEQLLLNQIEIMKVLLNLSNQSSEVAKTVSGFAFVGDFQH